MTIKHTKLPWVKVCGDEVGIVCQEDTQEYGMKVPILQVFSDNPERDVDLIVTAVNYHYYLWEALEYLLEQHPSNGTHHNCTDNGLEECEYCVGMGVLAELNNRDEDY